MKRRLRIGPVALLVFLALLALLLIKREHLTAGEAADGTVRTVVKLRDLAARHEYAAVGFLALLALIAFVTWTAHRTNQEKDKETPTRESSASDTKASR